MLKDHPLGEVVLARPSSAARDAGLAASVWDESAALVGLPAQPLLPAQKHVGEQLPRAAVQVRREAAARSAR